MYHLVWQSDWETLADDEFYRPASLASEGFIHCTHEPEKLVEVANLFFAEDRGDMLLRLTLDPAKIKAEIKEEDPGVGHLFPHIYGPMETNAVTAIEPMKRTAQGWTLPANS